MHHIWNLFIVVLLFSITIHAQTTGIISGKVVDATNGEILIGASVQVVGTTLGASTDIEGRFSIHRVPVGFHSLHISFVSYQTAEINEIKVVAAEETLVHVTLTPKTLQLQQITITGESAKNYEAALLNQRKKSLLINDGISSEQIKRTTDANMADALRRIPGVVLNDNRFINVRGLSERYSGALLNNAVLATTEPEKRSFAFDIVPSGLVDNTLVTKSYSVENSADFGSGLIVLNTVDFPVKPLLSLTTGSAYINDVTSKSYYASHAGSRDYLGFDDGSRGLPAGFPTNIDDISDPNQLFTAAKMLSNEWQTTSVKVPINRNLGFAYGDKFSVLDNDMGIILSLNYKRTYNYADITRRELMKELTIDGRYSERFSYKGSQSAQNVLWGAIGNISYKLNDFHKISIKNAYTVNADNEVANIIGYQNDQSSYRQNFGIRFISRTLLANQLVGDVFIPEWNGAQVQYQVSFSQSNRLEPDYRRYAYELDPNTNLPLYMILSYEVSPQLAGRYYSNLLEKSRAATFHIKVPVDFLKIKFGYSYTDKKRSFNSRLIGIVAQSATKESMKQYGIDSIFAAKNFRPNFGFSIAEYNNGTNTYMADEYNRSAYMLADIPLQVGDFEWNISAGMRVESVSTLLESFMQDNRLIPFSVSRDEVKFFPSVNIAIRMNEISNLKFSYSRTINRPEFRETAPFTYYDFQNQISTRGDTTLLPANITHYDIRYEMFPGVEEIVSVSFFYKEIRDAIESVIIPGSNAERSFRNTPMAKNRGAELEVRYRLGGLWEPLSGMLFVGNYSIVKSEINESRVDDNGLRKGVLRALQGQAPYTVNLALLYSNPDWGTSASISFYQSGKRIIETADPNDQRSISDIYEEARPLLDFVATQTLTPNLELKFSIKDIFGNEEKYTMLDYTIRTTAKHSQYSVGINFKL